MKNSCDLSFQQKSLVQQGYTNLSAQELKQLEWGLRFTPLVCSLITAYALYYQLPMVLFGVAALGIMAFFFPANHPMDMIYNYGVRHLFSAVKLPENPFQRRLACFAAGIMNTAAGVLFIMGSPTAAIMVGVMLLVLQAIVITTHFCTLSWMYEGLMRMIGNWEMPISVDVAMEKMNHGAILIDVRSPGEVANSPVKGAINFPVENIEQHVEELSDKDCILFCRSGARSHLATKKLKNLGLLNVHNLGNYQKAKQLADGNS